ncbi:hypothetical protein BDV30DRAFT_133588 [Aspergillus minisclerotigenes]|uniref:Uncharacterized protein n=1 Tax=Aspergillus minisclerotigenes TaxID=656917 RepID=A0A5N6J1K3_9EURO|nr:hypothetical protein BDV30DRAFT_133588 [Aspergillus minisclerotigenes]
MRHIFCLGMRTLRTLCRVTFCPRINYLRVIGRPQTLRGVGRRRNKRLYSNNTFHSLDKIRDVSWRTVILKFWMSEYKVTSDIPKDIPFPSPIWHISL